MILSPQGRSDALHGIPRRGHVGLGRRQPNPGASLLEALVDWWPLTEQSGHSIGARGNWAAPTGTPGAAIAPDGTLARAFGVANATIHLTTAQSSQWAFGDADYTVAAWMRRDASVQPYGIGACIDGEAYGFYSLQLGATFPIFYTSPNGTASYYAWLTMTPVVGTWYHLVGRHDSAANLLTLSVNAGAWTASTAYALGGRGGVSTGRVWIGGIYGGAGRPVSVQRAGIWRRVLTSAEEAWLYNSGRGRDYPFI